MRMITKWLAAAVVVATLTACADPSSMRTPQVPSGTPAVQPAWTSCAAEVPGMFIGADGISRPRLGEGFEPVAAIVCGTEPQRRPDGGEDLVATESRADDVTALVAALRLPDLSRTQDVCTLEMVGVAWFALLDATGQWVRPGLTHRPVRKDSDRGT